jgi:hypothetical protein
MNRDGHRLPPELLTALFVLSPAILLHGRQTGGLALYGQVSKIVVRKKYYCLADRQNSFDRHE